MIRVANTCNNQSHTISAPIHHIILIGIGVMLFVLPFLLAIAVEIAPYVTGSNEHFASHQLLSGIPLAFLFLIVPRLQEGSRSAKMSYLATLMACVAYSPFLAPLLLLTPLPVVTIPIVAIPRLAMHAIGHWGRATALDPTGYVQTLLPMIAARLPPPSLAVPWYLHLHVFAEYASMFRVAFTCLPWVLALPLAVSARRLRHPTSRCAVAVTIAYTCALCGPALTPAMIIALMAGLAPTIPHRYRRNVDVVAAWVATPIGLVLFHCGLGGWLQSGHLPINIVILALIVVHVAFQRLLLAALSHGDEMRGKLAMVDRILGGLGLRTSEP